jgi:hypothetical protein
MYWNNSAAGTIQAANRDGSGRVTLVTGQSDPHAVRLDLAGGKIYWPEFAGGRIRQANLDGTGLTTIVAGVSQPSLLELDVAGGKIYWSNQGTDDIRRANLDGSGQETLVTNQNNPAGIALDLKNGQMYWANVGGGDIRRSKLDGTSQEVLIRGLPGPAFISLDLTATSLAGDYNQDGIVDAGDYVAWRSGLGTTYKQTDYDVWRAHFGRIAGNGAAGYPLGASAEPLSAAVPEPLSWVLFCLGMIAVAIRRTI